MHILVIDDIPFRAKPLVNSSKFHTVAIAHGIEQVAFWLEEARIFPDLICLDHDMPGFSGTEVLDKFSDSFLGVNVWIWSHNIPKSKEMERRLIDLHNKVGISPRIWQSPITAENLSLIKKNIPGL